MIRLISFILKGPGSPLHSYWPPLSPLLNQAASNLLCRDGRQIWVLVSSWLFNHSRQPLGVGCPPEETRELVKSRHSQAPPKPTESESPGVGPVNLYFLKLLGWFPCIQSPDQHLGTNHSVFSPAFTWRLKPVLSLTEPRHGQNGLVKTKGCSP